MVYFKTNIVMAKTVTGETLERNYGLQMKFNEFQRQINQSNGYPYEFSGLLRHLQCGVEGDFKGDTVSSTERIEWRKKLKLFFVEYFEMNIDLSMVELPVRYAYSNYMIVPPDLSESDIFEKHLSGSHKIVNPKDGENIESFIKAKGKEQKRPEGLYAFAHTGSLYNIGPLSEGSFGCTPSPRNISSINIEEYINGKETSMTLKEYMLYYCFLEWERKWQPLDERTWTLLMTTDADGSIFIGTTFMGGVSGGRFWTTPITNRPDTTLTTGRGGPRPIAL